VLHLLFLFPSLSLSKEIKGTGLGKTPIHHAQDPAIVILKAKSLKAKLKENMQGGALG
jgi:hypothetical protein